MDKTVVFVVLTISLLVISFGLDIESLKAISSGLLIILCLRIAYLMFLFFFSHLEQINGAVGIDSNPFNHKMRLSLITVVTAILFTFNPEGGVLEGLKNETLATSIFMVLFSVVSGTFFTKFSLIVFPSGKLKKTKG